MCCGINLLRPDADAHATSDCWVLMHTTHQIARSWCTQYIHPYSYFCSMLHDYALSACIQFALVRNFKRKGLSRLLMETYSGTPVSKLVLALLQTNEALLISGSLSYVS